MVVVKVRTLLLVEALLIAAFIEAIDQPFIAFVKAVVVTSAAFIEVVIQ